MIQVCPLDVDFLKKIPAPCLNWRFQQTASHWLSDDKSLPDSILCKCFSQKFDYYGDDHPFFYYLCYSLFCLAEFNEKVKSRPSHSYPAFIIVDLETDFVA